MTWPIQRTWTVCGRGPSGRVLVTSNDTAAVPGDMKVLPVGPFNSREALGYLMGRLAADPAKRLGAVELISELGAEPGALAQASAVITSYGVSCHQYRDYFIRRRGQLTDSSGAPPSAAAVTWTLSFDHARTSSQPGGSAKLLLALAALLDGHGIPLTVFAAPAAGDSRGRRRSPGGQRARGGAGRAGTGRPADRRTGDDAAHGRISPVLQATLRAAMPEGMRIGRPRSAADALLQAWPEPELPGWPASGLRSCVATLRQIAGDLLWADGCHPLLLRAGESLDHARLTGPAVDHWRDLAATSNRLLGSGHQDTMLAGQRLADAYLAAGRAEDAVPWFQWVLDTQIRKLGSDNQDVIEARRRLGHALVAAVQLQDASPSSSAWFPISSRPAGPGTPTRSARETRWPPPTWRQAASDAIILYRRTLADRERAQEARHPQTMTTHQAWPTPTWPAAEQRGGICLQAAGDRPGARPRPDHLDTIAARNGLGDAYQKMGKTAAAEQAYEQARAGFERVLGPRHPDTLRSRAELARVYRGSGGMATPARCYATQSAAWSAPCPMDDPLIRELRKSLADIGEE